MKKYLVLMVILLTASSAWAAGTWSANNFSYKPQLTTQGTTDYTNFNTSQDRVDAKLGQIITVGDPSYPTFAAAITTLNAAGTDCVLRLAAGATYAITSSTTVNSNIAIKPDNGAVITIATGKTLTINGPFDAGIYHVFSCTGTGKVIFGRPNGVKELVPQWWGAKGDGIADDIIPLQAMVDCSVDSGGVPMFLPGGTYKISDTLKLNKGVAYAGFTVRGDGSSTAGGFGTVIDATAFGDRPALNIQGARRMVVQDIRVVGKNVAPITAASTIDPVLANWITAGCSNSQYAPYAGICIDAYQGVKPAGGYSNDVYGRLDSSYVMLRNVMVNGFVVGLCIAPCNVALDSDSVTVDTCQFASNTFGYSNGGSQSRSILSRNTDWSGNWCSFTTLRHGQQIGNCPSIYNGIIQQTWKIFEIGSANGNNPKTISGLHAESLGWLGEFGVTDSIILNTCP